jgi:hypothetical protein
MGANGREVDRRYAPEGEGLWRVAKITGPSTRLPPLPERNEMEAEVGIGLRRRCEAQRR